MKMNKLVFLTAAIISITSLTGCDHKIKRASFSEIIDSVDLKSGECQYYLANGRSHDMWLTDDDSYVMNELKKLEVKKRFTEPEDMNRFIAYDIYRYGYDYSLTSQIKFYENGSIIVDEYGTYVLDSYSYFTISKESASALFTFIEDRFDYAEEVKKENFIDTKDNKSVDKLFDSLKQETDIKCCLNDNAFIDKQGQLLGTLENIEYTYFDTVMDYPPSAYFLFLYNTTSIDNIETNPWFFALSRDYRTVYVVNYIAKDKVCRKGLFYYNIYDIAVEAGRTLYKEASRVMNDY